MGTGVCNFVGLLEGGRVISWDGDAVVGSRGVIVGFAVKGSVEGDRVGSGGTGWTLGESGAIVGTFIAASVNTRSTFLYMALISRCKGDREIPRYGLQVYSLNPYP